MKTTFTIETTDAESVEIIVADSPRGKFVWINLNGGCVFRALNPKIVKVNDRRTKPDAS